MALSAEDIKQAKEELARDYFLVSRERAKIYAGALALLLAGTNFASWKGAVASARNRVDEVLGEKGATMALAKITQSQDQAEQAAGQLQLRLKDWDAKTPSSRINDLERRLTRMESSREAELQKKANTGASHMDH